MAYSRREVQDYVTIMNKDLYDNLQDGVEEAKEEVVKKSKEANLYTDEKVAEVNQYVDSKVSEVYTKAETATSIAKGRNKAKVFSTTEDMQIWLSKEENKGLCNIGDNLYIVDTEVPDWWIAEVLNSVDEETGYYYKIALLETQKVDLSSYDEKLRNLEEDVEQQNENIDDVQNDLTELIIYNTVSTSVYVTDFDTEYKWEVDLNRPNEKYKLIGVTIQNDYSATTIYGTEEYSDTKLLGYLSKESVPNMSSLKQTITIIAHCIWLKTS